jgi:trimethylamine--corrinoid protein Co-methyltransferase
MLNSDDLERIDDAARALLEDPGVAVEHEEVARLLLRAGATEGRSPGSLRFSRRMVDDALALAPREISLADRRGKSWRVSPNSSSLFWTGAALFILDAGGIRRISREDLADFCRVIEALPNVDGVVGTSVEDAAPGHRDFAGLRVMATHTRKHLRALSFSPRGGHALVEMAGALSGSVPLRDNPILSVGFTAHGPLRWTGLALGVFQATAGHRIPCMVNGEPMAGASSPVTLAGTAAVGTAEILSGIVINQVLEPGRPCFFNLGFSHVMDMRAGFAVTGGPENCLFAVAGAELARFYGLPSASWMCTDSLSCDGQNALEKTLAAVTHAQARVGVVWGAGQVESEKTISSAQAAIDDEIIGVTRKFLAGMAVDNETLAVEETRRVGIAGSFLGSEHTFRNFRGAVYEPTLLERRQRQGSETAGGLAARAQARVASILALPEEPPLADAVARELDRIEKKFSAQDVV